ncbi:hypothetical protein HYW76_02925 [Candidatus Pacearchaeota archaeon]|nr:hypothetical protein [Candidatus Pacearchaeota archaeon]
MKKRETTGRKSEDYEKMNHMLLDNFVNLQKAMTNLAVKFDSLSDNISKLLQLFEISARSFAEKLASNPAPDIEKDREFLDKLNKLLDQNKIIAKGLTLMEEKLRERVYGGSPAVQQTNPLPQPRMISQAIKNAVKPASPEGYLPSQYISEKPKAEE